MHADLPCSAAYRLQWLDAVGEHREEILKAHRLPVAYTRGYYARRIEPYLSKTRYPEIKDPKMLYRGVFLSVDQLIEILEKGMKLGKVNWTAVGGGLSFTSSVQEASTYIFHNADDRPEGIGVVFEVKRRDEMVLAVDKDLNPTHTIFKLHEDLAPEEITNFFIWGQYGLESVDKIIERARADLLTNHEEWTHQFSTIFR